MNPYLKRKSTSKRTYSDCFLMDKAGLNLVIIKTTTVMLATLIPIPAWAAPIMDINTMTSIIFKALPFVLGVMILISLRTSRAFKGWFGEFLVMRALKQLDDQDYRQFHDVTLPTSDGTTQIDHIVVSRYGVFVIETKNMGGWIFGNQHDSKWTQTFGKHKKSFQNPLRQNFKHIKELESLLQIGEDKFYSVIVFAGDAKFKTAMPDNVLHSGLVRHILSKLSPLLTDHEMQSILIKINGAMLDRSKATSKRHISNLNKRFENKTSESDELIRLRILKLGIPALLMCTAMALLNIDTRSAQQPSKPTQTTQPTSLSPTSTTTVPTTSLQQENINFTFSHSEDNKPNKSTRSLEYGILTVTVQTDTHVTLYDIANKKIWSKEIKKGYPEEIELKKGTYTALTLQAGKKEISTVSFIGNNGILEF